jgi:L-malate glycosyltransferase
LKIKRIIQFSAGFNPGDAISNQMIVFKKFCEEKHIECEIYSENISPQIKRIAKRFKGYKPKKDDCIIYHHSIHSSILEFLLDQCKDIPKILLYHNVTPHHFFEPYDLKMSFYLKKGRLELFEMKDKFSLNLAVSEYNATELKTLNFSNVLVFPITLDFSKFTRVSHIQKNLNILFVGRIAPNKAQEDLIKFAKIFSDFTKLDFKLKLIGNTSPELILYKKELEALVKYFHLKTKVEFLDFVNHFDLCKEYSNADIFLCMSEHEGFCVPLLEAMFYNIPILAYDAGAVKETLKGSGIIFKEKNYLLISEIINKLSKDSQFKENIIYKQSITLNNYMQNNSSERFWSLLKQVNL